MANKNNELNIIDIDKVVQPKELHVIGICSWNWPVIRWLHSLRMSGYMGKITLISTNDIPVQFQKAYGFAVKRINVPEDFWNLNAKGCTTKLYPYLKELCLEIQKENPEIYILRTDIYDVIFQRNPSDVLNKLEKNKIYIQGEDILNKNNPYMMGWFNNDESKVLNKYPQLVDKEVFNAGVWMGHINSVINFCDTIGSRQHNTWVDQTELNVEMFLHPEFYSSIPNYIINLASTASDQVGKAVLDGYITINKETKEPYTIIHANGQTKQFLDSVYSQRRCELIMKSTLKGNPNVPLTVTAMISTKNRLNDLMGCIQSIANSIILPEVLVVYDDSEPPVDISKNQRLGQLTKILEHKGCELFWNQGQRKGQVHNHEHIRQTAQTDLIWRIDDDCIVEPNTLIQLLSVYYNNFNIINQIGAVGGSIITPPLNPPNQKAEIPSIDFIKGMEANNIRQIKYAPNLQWFFSPKPTVMPVDHLYSSFLYRSALTMNIPYVTHLSPACHREETMFTYAIRKSNRINFVNTGAITWHLRSPNGGIRNNPSEAWKHDEQIFNEWAKQNGIEFKEPVFIAGLHGLGDNIVLSNLVPEIVEKNKDKIIYLGTHNFEPYSGYENLRLRKINIDLLMNMINQVGQNPDDYSIYNLMSKLNWTDSMEKAYRKLYKIEQIEQVEPVQDNEFNSQTTKD